MSEQLEPKPAPRCPRCGSRLEVLRTWMFSPWETMCERGHFCRAWFDHEADVWMAEEEPLTEASSA